MMNKSKLLQFHVIQHDYTTIEKWLVLQENTVSGFLLLCLIQCVSAIAFEMYYQFLSETCFYTKCLSVCI